MSPDPLPLPSLDASQHFNCSICLELVYKPIVQACGHIFCFWCAHYSMNHARESHCPVCRRPYMYFPRICQLLHYMLAKACPDEYEKRGEEIRSTEEQRKVYSPQLELKHSWSPCPLKDNAAWTANETISVSTPRNDGHIPESHLVLQQVNGHEPPPISKETDSGSSDTPSVQDSLTVFDFLCSACHRLLYNPVVLNCGEAFCSSCLKRNADAGLYCPSCENTHPGGSVSICLELHHFLENAFPTEYANRRQEQIHQDIKEETHLNGRKISDIDMWPKGSPHRGVGCDGCGMFPIIGEGYLCEDCPESIGFDLCGPCYRKGGDLVGRFNQAHRSDHRMINLIYRNRNRNRAQQPVLSIQNSTIQRRRQQQQQQHLQEQQQEWERFSDLDDYIESFIG